MSNSNFIFFPLLALVLLTACVWLWMYKTRIAEMKRNNIKPQAISNSADSSRLLKSVAAPSDNFSNLFEMPVLFYVAVITLYVTQMVDALVLVLASLYVLFRYLHSFIHISYNHVMHRFIAYIASSLVLWILWIIIGFRLLSTVTIQNI